MIVSYHQVESSLIRVERDVEARNSLKDMVVIDEEEPQKISFHGFLRNAAAHVNVLSLSQMKLNCISKAQDCKY